MDTKNNQTKASSLKTLNNTYASRMSELMDNIQKTNLKELDIKEDDLKDPFCNPEKPVKVEFSNITAAAVYLKGAIDFTPCTKSHMSTLTGMEIFFKKDFLQNTGSFKERGARYSLISLSEEQKSSGVIAASAGNHALALCYHGQQLSIPVICVMPKIAPMMKVNNCKQYGAIVIVAGADLAESKRIAMKLAKIFSLMYINGYDHPNIIAGQGTMGLEILEQVSDIDAIVVPTGGGGLLAGVAVAAKKLKPSIQIICAETAKCPSFKNALENGGPTYTKSGSTLADGLAVATVGLNSYVSAAHLIDKCVLVKEEYIAIAILRLVEMEKAVVEGAGACGLAAVLQGLLPELKGKRVVIPLSGGNIDTNVLGRVLEHGLVADNRLVKASVVVSDRPGGFSELSKLIASKGAGIKDIYNERAWIKNDIFSVQVQLSLEVRDDNHAREIEAELRNKYEDVLFSRYENN